MPHNVLTLLDIPASDLPALIDRGREMKVERTVSRVLENKTLAMVFEKSSTRTRVSFEVAVNELGGKAVFMTPSESQLGRSEPLRDTARCLSQYTHGMIVRTFAQANLNELTQHADIPVVNALSDSFHPCQVLSDLLTVSEYTPDFSSLTIAWVGDGNNMAHSWINAARLLPFRLRMAVPKGFGPDQGLVQQAVEDGADIVLSHDPEDAVRDADYINTDAWFSMGQEEEERERALAFEGFQINARLLEKAPVEAKVLHCLPAHRGQEISEEVLESERSLVWEQAGNRLHMQKALLEWVYA
ncbi:ornithine carbamoyltransferase [Desulfovermiculus halophilus]|jgi:ornithine carbamoyltransferase|uniref:ornithine carbamoyltransferase n=1 Tax=Desulfovermiculus halophilus TaxID=339722 RepID=UPI00048340E1|nr:ornithine carbamoyltransferase [Desulfovermiculus halophilus]